MNDLTQSPVLYLNKNKAMETLINALRNGYLALFIGAGVSKSASKYFPDWESLVKTCCEEKNLEFVKRRGVSNTYLRKRMEEVERHCSEDEFLKLVKDSLYKNIEYNIDVMKTSLLVALGALVMGSVRGSAGTVVNYNFDDLLEWYLDFHGFHTQIIHDYPSLKKKSDITIYHPHGFLPKLNKYKNFKSKTIVITEQSYQAIIGEQVNPWNELQRSIMGCSLALFVGLSGDDPHIGSLCEAVYNRLLNKKRIIGFQVLKDTNKNREDETYNLRRGIVNLYIDDYKELPELLLRICREAANLQ